MKGYLDTFKYLLKQSISSTSKKVNAKVLLVIVSVLFASWICYDLFLRPEPKTNDKYYEELLRQNAVIIAQEQAKIDSLTKLETDVIAKMAEREKKLAEDSIQIIKLKNKLHAKQTAIDTFKSADVVNYFNNRYSSK